MKNVAIFDPRRLLKALCMIVLIFIPISMVVSPAFDFFTVEERGANWTVTMSTFVFLLSSMFLFAAALFSLKSPHEKLFLWCMIAFFIYAFLFTIYSASDLFYPIFGLISVLGSTLVGILFYVSAKDNIISPKAVFYSLAFASVFVMVPLLLIQIDTERYARLTQEVGTSNILYGYENPRALGWISTICLSLLAAHLTTQPKEIKLSPILLLLAIIAATTLFWSGSRGGIVAFTASISVVLFLSRTRNQKGILSIVSCIAAGGAISYFLHLPSSDFGIFSRISQNLGQESVAAISSGRTELWQLTISYILERPFTGYGYLPHKNLAGFTHGSAHNIILDAWLWFGLIVGTMVLLLGLMLWIKACATFLKANDHYVSALFCVVTTLLAYSMVSGPYARTFPLLLFAISSGVILGIRASKTN